jgi:undecaprenyl-diphosphatase
VPDWLQIVLLGAIEGITEFLPISSTGHLLIAEQWLGHRGDLFNIVVQSGAVLAVLAAFSTRLKSLAREWRSQATQQYVLKLFAAFCLTGVGGVLLKKAGFKLPEEAAPVAWATFIGGVLILIIERWLRGKPLQDEITWTMALLIGVGQLLAAVFPGASRSGTTILMALALGLSRPVATEFSFLLGIPTLLAAGALQIYSAAKDGQTIAWSTVILGAVAAALTAFVAVKWLLRYIQTHTFVAFGWYRIIVGAILLLWFR